MSFKSFLTAVGQDFKKGLDYTLRLEPAIEAGLQIADPPVAALLHVTTATILSVEQKFAAMGAQSGTGPQKAAQSIQILEPLIKSILTPYGINVDTAYVQKYIDSFVAILNLLPAISVPAPAPVVTKVAVPVSGGVQAIPVAVVNTPAISTSGTVTTAGADPVFSNAG